MLPACSCVCDRSDKQRKDTKKSEFDKEKTNRRAISTVNGCLVADKLSLSFLSLEVRSCDTVHVTAVEAKGLFTCSRPCTDRKCHAALNHARIQWLTLTALAHKYRNFARQSTNSALKQERNHRGYGLHWVLYTKIKSKQIEYTCHSPKPRCAAAAVHRYDHAGLSPAWIPLLRASLLNSCLEYTDSQ